MRFFKKKATKQIQQPSVQIVAKQNVVAKQTDDTDCILLEFNNDNVTELIKEAQQITELNDEMIRMIHSLLLDE